MKHIAKIEKTHEFSTQDINDIVCTAIEGGINYWCGAINRMRNEDGTLSGVSEADRSNVQDKCDVIGYGGTLILFDVDYPMTKQIWYLNADNLLKGIVMYCDKHNVLMSELIDNHDAETADLIVQYGLFGEITYA
jgi:hypothetical protein